MTPDVVLRRRFFAEEIQAIANLTSPALIDAFASVPREAFLRPGPWLVQGEGDVGRGPRLTPDADPRHVYHNVAIAIDAARMLFNGAPNVVGMAIDACALRPGGRVLHVGCGLGYYTALLAHCVGPEGRVLAIEVDGELAAEARANLSPYPGVEVRHDGGLAPIAGPLDAILVNAGVTHPLPQWLDALGEGGRLVLPLTCAFGPAMPIGKGFLVAVARTGDALSFEARVITLVAIYSAIGLRDRAANDRLGDALKRSPRPAFTRLRRDGHDPAPSCWLHGDRWCLSA